jgi:hypothetical protein
VESPLPAFAAAAAAACRARLSWLSRKETVFIVDVDRFRYWSFEELSDSLQVLVSSIIA